MLIGRWYNVVLKGGVPGPVIVSEDLLRVSIDEVLNRIFGVESAKLILRHIEKARSLTNSTSTSQALSYALRGLFGPGSLIIEREILRHLSSALESKSRRSEILSPQIP